MLTRLRVSGFKNLVGVDVRFGPFTCIAGANGVGKSNLFDAIRFLSALADRPLVEAARSVRDESARAGDVRSLFHRVGGRHADAMEFEADMIVSPEGTDDLGQVAEAGITFLRYTLSLAYRPEGDNGAQGGLQLTREQLEHLNLGDATQHLLFPHKRIWRKSVLQGRRSSPYISTEGEGTQRVIKLHQDGTGGRTAARPAASLPRTVLSAVYAAESPTALLARRELQSWRLLQLEPSALRRPDDFTAPTRLGVDGSHLPATLAHLSREQSRHGGAKNGSDVQGQVAARLAQLINDVRAVSIDRDEKRELLTLQVTDHEGTVHPARALSDGTLRFLALAVLDLDASAQGLLCLEEPENGIHPERIPAMLRLLQDLATDVEEPVGPDNPLRQVIVNTHSPAVVQQVPEDCLLVAESRESVAQGQRFSRVCFSGLPDTWRAREGAAVVSKGKLLAYLNPGAGSSPTNGNEAGANRNRQRVRRVRDRPDLQPLLFPAPDGE